MSVSDDELDGTQSEYAFETITGLLPALSVKVFAENFRPEVPNFPRPCRLTWAGLDVQLQDANLRLEEATVFLTIRSRSPREPFEHRKYRGLLNEPATVELEDGSTLWCPFAHLGRWSTSMVEFSFSVWEWLAGSPSEVIFLGIGRTRLPGCADNLLVEAEAKSGRGHFRGEGRFTWHALKLKEDTAFLAEGAAKRECAYALGWDLMAMEYAFGTDIALDVLWLLDANGSTVGGVGLDRRSSRNDRRRCPSPDRTNEHYCWTAPLFRAVAAAIGDERPDLLTAVTGYMDALRVHIHGGYLLAQVALEAFCKSMLSRKGSKRLVTSKKAWRKFLRENDDAIRNLCPDGPSYKILLANLGNAIRPPAGRTVPEAFEQFGVALPAELLNELKKRGESAHNFTMFDEIQDDVQEASDRVEMVQTMLAAAIAMAVGYKGQLAGWERDSTGHQKPADFWPARPEPEALVQYLIGVEAAAD